MNLKLGKLPPKHNPKTLMFSKFIKADALPIPPERAFWEYKIPDGAWGMDGNDEVGDCTCAAIAHMLMNWTAHTGQIVVPTTPQVLQVYSDITGYDPSQTDANGVNPTDSGAAITDVLDYWKTKGIAGHKIDGWVSIDPTNIEHIKLAIYLFGGIDGGLNLPQSAMDQFNADENWDLVTDDGGIIGGHSVPGFGYGSQGKTGLTWAKRQPMSWAFVQKYYDEFYSVLSLDWLNSSKVAPNHLDITALTNALKAISD
jgi:hypothetical protein